MKNNVKFITKNLVLFSLILILPNCAKYKAKRITYPNGEQTHQKDVYAVKKVLNQEECKHFLDRKITNKGYVPVQIFVKNNSDKMYKLEGINIDLPLEKGKKVAKKLHKNVGGRLAAYGLTGFVLPPLWIAGAVEVPKSNTANKKLDLDFEDKIIDENSTVYIRPHRSINKILFVEKSNYSANFNVTLEEKDNPSNKIILCM